MNCWNLLWQYLKRSKSPKQCLVNQNCKKYMQAFLGSKMRPDGKSVSLGVVHGLGCHIHSWGLAAPIEPIVSQDGEQGATFGLTKVEALACDNGERTIRQSEVMMP